VSPVELRQESVEGVLFLLLLQPADQLGSFGAVVNNKRLALCYKCLANLVNLFLMGKLEPEDAFRLQQLIRDYDTHVIQSVRMVTRSELFLQLRKPEEN